MNDMQKQGTADAGEVHKRAQSGGVTQQVMQHLWIVMFQVKTQKKVLDLKCHLSKDLTCPAELLQHIMGYKADSWTVKSLHLNTTSSGKSILLSQMAIRMNLSQVYFAILNVVTNKLYVVYLMPAVMFILHLSQLSLVPHWSTM